MSNSINQGSMLRVGTMLHDTYRVDDYLASGGFGNTYIVTNIQFGERYAIKEFFLKGVTERDSNTTTVSVSNQANAATFQSQKEKFKKEAVRLRKLSSPNIVRVHDLFEENGTAYYVMDFIDGVNLRDKLSQLGHPIDEKTVWNICNQVLDALAVVHGQGLFHLDLKPANLMMDKQGHVELIDFGASKQMSGGNGATTSTAVSYTNGYAPREQMEQNLEKFGPWTDFYALGATLFSLLTNTKPPLPSDIDDDLTADKHLSLPMPAGVSDPMRRLVLWLMATNRRNRPQSVDEIRAFIEKPGTPNAKPEEEEKEENKHDETIVMNDDTVARWEQHNSNQAQEEHGEDANNEPETSEENEEVSRTRSNWKWLFLVLALAAIAFFAVSKFSGSSQESSDSSAVADTAATQKAAPERPKVQQMQVKIDQGTCKYSGEVNDNNVPDGMGEAWFKDGRYYKGAFVNGTLQDTDAFFRYENGDTYRGIFKDNLFYRGTYTKKNDGSYFKGFFKDGDPYNGTWYDKSGRKICSVKDGLEIR